MHTKTLRAQQFNLTTSFEGSLRCEVTVKHPNKLLEGCIYRSNSGTNETNFNL